MPIDYRKDDGRLVWVRNPFTGTITYLTDIHKKRSGFLHRASAAGSEQPPDWRAAETARFTELESAKRDCPFCPGNEHLTTEELLRISPAEVTGAVHTSSTWLIRAFPNLFPRIPECCTGGRNESYVVVEDPRHFADGAQHQAELLYSALLPVTQMQAVLQTTATIAGFAYTNPSVQSVIIRKNQGRESGASQPNLHNQVIGCDQVLPPILRERECLEREPRLWKDILTFVEGEGFLIAQQDDCFLYFCPFGTFPRSYEVVCPDSDGRISEIAPARFKVFAALLHRALAILGPLPLDYEIHHGPGIPLHVHVNARHFPYSNIGGTLNLPANIGRSSHQ